MSNNSSLSVIEDEKLITTVLYQLEETSSVEVSSLIEWPSLERVVPQENKKRLLFEQGLYNPGSGEICAKHVTQSQSSTLNHLLYKYPPVQDPGIMKALLKPDVVIYPSDDGQDIYQALCNEMNICPVRIFHRGLLTDEINLSYYGLNPSGVRPMAMALNHNRFVKKLNLTDNFLTQDACYHLGQMLGSNVALQELNLTGCRIGPAGLLRLANCLQINRTLTVLNLARNNIEDVGGTYIARMICDGVTVERFNLSNNGLSKQSALAFAEVFQYRDKITHLDLSLNSLFQVGPTAKMLNSLAFSTKLEELNLAWNALEGEQIAECIKNLMKIPTLKILDLSNNRFSGEAITIIVSNLKTAQKLVTLDLSSNPLRPNDALRALEQMLIRRVKLKTLYMANVLVSKNFLVVLDMVKKMKSRQNFVVTFDTVLENWTTKGEDPRELILKRADYLTKIHKVDVVHFFVMLNQKTSRINVKDLIDRVGAEKVPLDGDLIEELANVFPGPKSKTARLINLDSLCEFMQRLWPKKMQKLYASMATKSQDLLKTQENE